MEWQPIETAPEDGTWIRAKAIDGTEHRVSWGRNRHGALCWCTETGWLSGAHLTHWQPEPPATLTGDSHE